MMEIKLIGSGGQGAVVAGKLLGITASKSGQQTQSFSSFGYSRRGGTTESYVRISEEKIRIHTKMYEHDYLVLMGEELTKDRKVISGLKENGVILINSRHAPEYFSSLGSFGMVTVDADHIALNAGLRLSSGIPIINTAILGAIAGIIPLISIEQLAEAIREVKIPDAEKNVEAAKEAYHRVRLQLTGTAVTEIKGEEVPKIDVEQLPVYQTRISSCEANCPAGEAIRTTLSLIQNSRFEEALESIRAENPFPGICGRICFHPCETHCNRNEFDESLSTCALERAAFDYADQKAVRNPTKRAKTRRKVAVIGSGPAGMACAYFSAIMGHDVTVFEALAVLGGIPKVGIPTYRLPRDVVDREMREIVDLGIEVRLNTEVGKEISFEDIAEKYSASFIASGAHHSTRLNIPGESTKGVMLGLDFLKDVAFGKDTDLGAKVAVIGGGNTAVDAARTAKRLGAKEVSIIYRRSRDEMPAYREEVAAAEAEGVRVLYLTMPVKIHTNRERIEKLECVKAKLSGKDKDGRSRSERIDGTNFMVTVDTVIAALGETLEAPFLPNAIKMEGGLIKVDYWGRTSMEGVYAGGDATTLSRSVVDAIASGKRAALGIDLFLANSNEKKAEVFKKEESGAISFSRYSAGNYRNGNSGVVSFTDLNTNYFSKSPRNRGAELPAEMRSSNFNEVRLGLTRDEAISEAKRCFQCGHCDLCGNCYTFCPDVAIMFEEKTCSFSIDREGCKRCGICIEECPRNAITWERGAK